MARAFKVCCRPRGSSNFPERAKVTTQTQTFSLHIDSVDNEVDTQKPQAQAQA